MADVSVPEGLIHALAELYEWEAAEVNTRGRVGLAFDVAWTVEELHDSILSQPEVAEELMSFLLDAENPRAVTLQGDRQNRHL